MISAIDQRGWGGSSAVDGRYDLEAAANDVVEVIAALRIERFILVRHSMGGKVAQIRVHRSLSRTARADNARLSMQSATPRWAREGDHS